MEFFVQFVKDLFLKPDATARRKYIEALTKREPISYDQLPQFAPPATSGVRDVEDEPVPDTVRDSIPNTLRSGQSEPRQAA